MNRPLWILLSISLALFSLQIKNPSTSEVTIVVSPDGDDGQSGTPEAPLKTLTAALEQVAATLAEDSNTDVSVRLRAGTYYLTETLRLTPAHSPADGHQLTIAPYQDERVTLSSAQPLSGWKKVTTTKLNFPERTKERLWEVSLPANQGRAYSLYREEHRLTNAESAGFSPTKMPPKMIQYAYEADSVDFTRLYFDEEAPLHNVARPESAELRIIPKWPWTMNILPVSTLDTTKNVLRTALPGTYGLYRTEWRQEVYTSAWLLNLPEHLDQPGEWVYDPAEHKVYLWPALPGTPENIYLPTLRELMLVGGEDGQPTKNISIRGLRFVHGQRDHLEKDDIGLQHDFEWYDKGNALLRFRNAEDCRVDQCTFTASDGGAIRLDLHCQRIKIQQNIIKNIGGTGILLAGYGPGTKDVNHHNTVSDNEIAQIGEIVWSSPGVLVWQSGDNLIKNNTLHDLPYSGIVVSGVRPEDFNRQNVGLRREATPTIRFDEVPDREISGLGTYADYEAYLPFLHSRNNLVEGNEVYRCVLSMGDGNALYVSGAGRGNQLVDNYLHDHYAPGFIQMIRCDDYQVDVTIAHNRLENGISGGISIKGRNNIIGNTIVNVLDRSPSLDQSLEVRGYILVRGPAHGSIIRDNVMQHRGGPAPIFEEGRALREDGGVRLEDCVVKGNIFYHEQSPQYSHELQDAYRKRGVNEGGAAKDMID